MPRIIFVRPAETDYHHSEIMLGRFDVDLNEHGHKEAKKLAKALIPYKPSYLAASPHKRAIATALAIEDANAPLNMYPVGAFQAMDLGDWEKRTVAHVKNEDAARYKAWLSDPDFPAPGGESMREVYARAFPELVNIVSNTDPSETLVLVLQLSVIKALSCGVLDLPLENAQRFSMEKAAYSVFERLYPGGPYQLMTWNRTAHLETVEKPSRTRTVAYR